MGHRGGEDRGVWVEEVESGDEYDVVKYANEGICCGVFSFILNGSEDCIWWSR